MAKSSSYYSLEVAQHWKKQQSNKQIFCEFCERCGASFKQKSKLLKHIDQVHSKTELKQAPEKEAIEEDGDRGSLEKHQEMNNETKQYKCLQCEKEFCHQSSLRRHKRQIHKKVNPFKCLQCGKDFGDKTSLERHKPIHNDVEKVHQCLQCGKKYSHKETLTKHEQIHNVNPFKRPQQFKCSYCQKECWDKRRLKRHEMIHTGVRPFKCHQCGKDFSYKLCLEIHERTHTGEKPFKCSYCGKAFIDKSSASKHEYQVHSKRQEAQAKPGSLMSLLLELKSILTCTQTILTDSNSDYLQLLEKIAIWRQSGYDVVMGTYLDSESVLAVNGLNQLSVQFTRIGDEVDWTMQLESSDGGCSGLVAKGSSSNFYTRLVSCLERFLMWDHGEFIEVEVKYS